MKIIFEDSELEAFVLSGESCIAVPVEVRQKDGECIVTAYSSFEKTISEYAGRFEADPFCQEALLFLMESLSSPMEQLGYTFDSRGDFLIYRYTADASYKKPETPCKYETVRIDTNEAFERYYNNVTRDAELDDDDPLDVCFAAVRGDEIVSFAAINDMSDDDSYEINVESAPEVRGSGCATAVVSQLCEYIVSKGERVSYRCRASNKASARVAEKAGLAYDGRSYSFVCYNNRERE